MITFTKGNLLESDAEALVNTVNTVGVMGKGVALMFKERFKENYKRYREACSAGEVQVGRMFVTRTNDLMGPKWIVNFPTKKHWRNNSRMEWVEDGLEDLKRVIQEESIRSIALPPLGAGNGGLEWQEVRAKIEDALSSLDGVEILVYEPTSKYQNVQKKSGVLKLTPARAIVVELIRRYWLLGVECTMLEIQKLAWFAERVVERSELDNVLQLHFQADKFGPYASRLNHLLNSLDGSFLHCEKRISDAGPLDTIWFEQSKNDYLQTYLRSSEFRPYTAALESTAKLIEGYESPYGLELLATIDWLIHKEDCMPKADDLRRGLGNWPRGAERKLSQFDSRAISIALKKLEQSALA